MWIVDNVLSNVCLNLSTLANQPDKNSKDIVEYQRVDHQNQHRLTDVKSFPVCSVLSRRVQQEYHYQTPENRYYLRPDVTLYRRVMALR